MQCCCSHYATTVVADWLAFPVSCLSLEPQWISTVHTPCKGQKCSLVITQEVTAILGRPWGFKVRFTALIWSGQPPTAIKNQPTKQTKPTNKTPPQTNKQNQPKNPPYTIFLFLSKPWVWRMWKRKPARKSTTKWEFYHLFCNTYTKWGVSLLVCNKLFFKVIKASHKIKMKYHMYSGLFLWRFLKYIFLKIMFMFCVLNYSQNFSFW